MEKAIVEITPGVEIELPAGNHVYKASGCTATIEVKVISNGLYMQPQIIYVPIKSNDM